MNKTLVNADEYVFKIRELQNGAYGVFLINEDWSEERLLNILWTIGECKSFIFSNFVGEKGTKFNIMEE